jgi:hypothetical protein
MNNQLISLNKKQASNIIDNFCGDRLSDDEKEVIINKFIDSVPELLDELIAQLESCIDWYFEEKRPQYLRDLEEGRLENDAYERFRQKQIDEAADFEPIVRLFKD